MSKESMPHTSALSISAQTTSLVLRGQGLLASAFRTQPSSELAQAVDALSTLTGRQLDRYGQLKVVAQLPMVPEHGALTVAALVEQLDEVSAAFSNTLLHMGGKISMRLVDNLPERMPPADMASCTRLCEQAQQTVEQYRSLTGQGDDDALSDAPEPTAVPGG